MREAIYSISIDGQDVSSAFVPLLLSLTIRQTDGGQADTCEIELDDTEGQIELPSAGAQISAELEWDAINIPETATCIPMGVIRVS